ncbi:MAG: hypothetical protein RML84_09320 [Anaerolineae bacterium]|nr:hypothetical protein [Anaerolineae bacterium]
MSVNEILSYCADHGPILIGCRDFSNALEGEARPVVALLRPCGAQLACVVLDNDHPRMHEVDMPDWLDPIAFLESVREGVVKPTEEIARVCERYRKRISELFASAPEATVYKVVVEHVTGALVSTFTPWYEWQVERWQYAPWNCKAEVGGLWAYSDLKEARYEAEYEADQTGLPVYVFEARARRYLRDRCGRVVAELMRLEQPVARFVPEDEEVQDELS